jgi:arginase family enzyme
MGALESLEQILAPAGGGIHVVSTGVAETRALQRSIYRAARDADIDTAWKAQLRTVAEAKVVVLGVPSDTGAGFVRGANMGPSQIRKFILQDSEHSMHSDGVVDAGDVRVVPHLLSGEMISAEQVARSRAALYGDEESPLPVAPLDQCALALRALRELNPDALPIVLGGDHSVGWPAFSACYDWSVAAGKKIGLLHFDAHTDLLEERLGVRYCFATWAYHANELLNRDGRLVQVGIRASGQTQEHWESTLGVRQYWPEEYQHKSTPAMADEIAKRFAERGVDCLYISNDIDGTDSAFASATGTPEDNGLHPDQVSELSLLLAKQFPLVGADLVEVAPPLGSNNPNEPQVTLETASRYLNELIALGL